MRYYLFLILLFAIEGYAQENSIIGKWADKSEPEKYQFVFAPKNDFTFTRRYKNQYKQEQVSTSRGVWEIGSWKITHSEDNVRRCNLTVYADSVECCYAFRFISNNLILTKEHSSSGFSLLCENRVLVPLE